MPFVLISNILKYVFVLIVYMFIFAIVRMIYLDIFNTRKALAGVDEAYAYLKLISLKDKLPYKVSDSYNIKETVVIGNGPKCNISINDPLISPSHAQIFLRDGVYYILDLNSASGTYVNGEKISDKPVKIEDTDKIAFGKISFMFIDKIGLKGGRK